MPVNNVWGNMNCVFLNKISPTILSSLALHAITQTGGYNRMDSLMQAFEYFSC